ncbi:thiol protease aleurain-like protein [Tanacetum coccineum]
MSSTTGALEASCAQAYGKSVLAAFNGVCKYSSDNAPIRIFDAVNITIGVEDELKHAVGVVQPASVVFQVIANFRLHTGGLFASDNCGSDPMVNCLLTHLVL